jgi:hypothetical protein
MQLPEYTFSSHTSMVQLLRAVLCAGELDSAGQRIVLLVVTGVVQNAVVVVIVGFELGVGVVTGTDRGVDVVGFQVLRVVVAGGVCCDISR